jgi:murein DD-endopeptidase MepM/ murein hydrolase activator NlpD
MIKFDDGHGNVFTLVHVKPLASVGASIKGGEAVAYIFGDGAFATSGCWSGGHLHLEVTHNGSYVDPLALLKALGCNAPPESQCKF